MHWVPRFPQEGVDSPGFLIDRSLARTLHLRQDIQMAFIHLARGSACPSADDFEIVRLIGVI